jgi:tripartite-type tricarboxylate transporter receptor subunit TctC
MLKWLRAAGVMMALGAASMGAVFAQSSVPGPYPAKPIRMLAPEPGGGNEVAGRIVSQGLSARLGQQVVIDNRGAAGGTIAAGIVVKAAPDGYTMLVYGSSLWLAPFLRKNVTYDAIRDFTPISLAAEAPFFIFVHASVPAKTVKEFIALVKAKPGDLLYGSAGSGAATHLAAELFKSMAGVNITRVAYKGSGQAANAMAGGEIQVMFGSASLGMAQVKTGRLRVLAVTTAKPSALAPGLPTVAASGLPGYEAGSMVGFFGPAKMPKALAARLSQEIKEVVKQPDVKEKFLSLAIEPVGTTPEEFVGLLRTDMAKWGKVIKEAGIIEE